MHIWVIRINWLLFVFLLLFCILLQSPSQEPRMGRENIFLLTYFSDNGLIYCWIGCGIWEKKRALAEVGNAWGIFANMSPILYSPSSCAFFLWLHNFYSQEVWSTKTPLSLGQPCDMLWPKDYNGRVQPDLQTHYVFLISLLEAGHCHKNSPGPACWMPGIVLLSHLCYLGQLACQPQEMCEAVLTPHSSENAPAEHIRMSKQ